MPLIKKNILSIICGVIALLAVVLYFYPLGSMISDAQAMLNGRVAAETKMRGLLTRQRSLPVVDIAGGQPQPLGKFPTAAAIEVGKVVKEKIAQQAKGVAAIAVQVNQRKPLIDNALPVPDPTKDFEFRDAYFAALADLPKQLRAVYPPSDGEMKAAMEGEKHGDAAPAARPVAGFAEVQNQEALKEQQDRLRSLIEGRANSGLVYLTPTALAPNPQIAKTGTPPTPAQIWYAQMNLWLQWDVARAVYEVNEPFGSVVKAPVKNLISLQIKGYRTSSGTAPGAGGSPMSTPPGMPMGGPMGGPGMPYGMPGFPGMGMPPRPSPAPTPAPAAGGSAGGTNFAASPTGRACNDAYDVVPFDLVVHVETDKLPLFLEQLSKGRFITPFSVTVQALDSVNYQGTQNVVYGPSPVVTATISCEYLMLRDWTVRLMPIDVKKELGVPTAPGVGAAQGIMPQVSE